MQWKVVLGLGVLCLTGCATKQYARATPVSSYEGQQYTCRDIRLELAKVDAIDEQIKQQAKFSAMSVASFLGDFGIGNVAARHAAENSSAQRRAELNSLAASKGCTTAVSDTPTSSQAPSALVKKRARSTETVLAAQHVATAGGCGDVSEAGDGRFIAQCSGFRMQIECEGTTCRPIRSLQ